MLNPDELVTEASNSNVLLVIEDRLITPAATSGILRGITKAAIARLGAGQGMEVHETDVSPDDLTKATECFVTSATREVMPVAAIRLEDGQWREFPAGGGEVTRRVARAYQELVHEYVEQHQELRLC